MHKKKVRLAWEGTHLGDRIVRLKSLFGRLIIYTKRNIFAGKG